MFDGIGRNAPVLAVVATRVFAGILIVTALLARRGVLPRTRRIVPGELAISD